MYKFYEDAELEVILFEAEDIITDSKCKDDAEYSEVVDDDPDI